MKKLFFATVVAAIAFAVNSNAQISVGVGYANESVVSKESAKLDDEIKGYSWEKGRMKLDGIYVEVAYNWDFTTVGSGALSLQPGIKYNWLTSNQSSAKTRVSGDYDGKKYKANYASRKRYANHFVDIPIHLKYSYDFVPGTFKAYAFAGPVISLGLAAKSVSCENGSASYDGETEKGYELEKVNAYNGKYYVKYYDSEAEKYEVEKEQSDDYKAYNMFDLKLALGLGVTVSEKVDIKMGYNLGLLNRAFHKNDDDVKYSAHSNVLYFGVAYNF